MRAKTMSYETKLMGVDEPEPEGPNVGRVRAVVSCFGNVDFDGDRIVAGAFTDTLGAWKAKGDPIPWIWSHEWHNPDAHVGWVPPDMAEETDRGLEVTAHMDLDDPAAAKVYRLLKDRRITQFSFAYNVLDDKETDEKTDKGPLGKVMEIRRLELYECGPTLLGSNQETELLEVAARKVDGRKQVTGPERERLARAVDLIESVMSSDEEPDTDARGADVKDRAVRAKGAIGYTHTGTSDAPWDGGAAERAISNDAGAAVLRREYAWVDPSGDPDVKSSYSLPHHFVSNGRPGAASTRGCSAAIGVLNGARGGSRIPASDRQATYNHLAHHLRDADMEPPELASADAEDAQTAPPDASGGGGWAELAQIEALAAGV